MRLRRAARLSFRALAAHRLRTALALVSVALGVGSVLLTSAIGRGAQAEVQRGIDAAGSNLLVVRPALVKRSAARKDVRGTVTTLRLEDYEAIAAHPQVVAAAPAVDGPVRVKAETGSVAVSVLGTTPDLVRLRNLRVRSGRFLDDEDDRTARRVAVLGDRVARTLFGHEDPVGRDVRIRGVPFEVVGRLEPKGILADGSDQDGSVFVPVRTALRRVFNVTWLSAAFVSVAERPRMREVESGLRDLLRERHRLRAGAPDDFVIQDQVRLLAMQERGLSLLTRLTAGLAGLSILVGGAGILALMLLSVKERTAEIGLRMAVGARRRDVLLQFLGEATLLALAGWVAGLGLAGLGALGVATGTAWRFGWPAGAVGATLLMAVGIGVVFGAWPALGAARLPPVRALGARA